MSEKRPQRRGDHGAGAAQIEPQQNDQADGAGRHAAGSESPRDLPAHGPGKPIDARAAGLGRGRIEQIGAGRRGRTNA
jgi:hypothetical protein